ncbi:hypothetical protein AB0J43_00165 [Nonomuraea fuscirosea]
MPNFGDLGSGTCEQHAQTNLAAFIAKIQQSGVSVSGYKLLPQETHDGRWTWIVFGQAEPDQVTVTMPGLPPTQVRGEEPDLPRLCVDGCWQPWQQAVDLASDKLDVVDSTSKSLDEAALRARLTETDAAGGPVQTTLEELAIAAGVDPRLLEDDTSAEAEDQHWSSENPRT